MRMVVIGRLNADRKHEDREAPAYGLSLQIRMSFSQSVWAVQVNHEEKP